MNTFDSIEPISHRAQLSFDLGFYHMCDMMDSVGARRVITLVRRARLLLWLWLKRRKDLFTTLFPMMTFVLKCLDKKRINLGNYPTTLCASRIVHCSLTFAFLCTPFKPEALHLLPERGMNILVANVTANHQLLRISKCS